MLPSGSLRARLVERGRTVSIKRPAFVGLQSRAGNRKLPLPDLNHRWCISDLAFREVSPAAAFWAFTRSPTNGEGPISLASRSLRGKPREPHAAPARQ
jgi:hypothetical protein